MEENRDEHRRRWWHDYMCGAHMEPSMKRRKRGHDYRKRCIYMITLVVEGRRPLLGTLRDADEEHERAWVEPSELGRRVLECWKRIKEFHHEMRGIDVQLMPDHLHGILFMTRYSEQPLGVAVNGFKHGCNEWSRNLGFGLLWEVGYQDTILSRRGQLDVMKAYLHDNPYRLWVKRHRPEFFVQQHGVQIGEDAVTIAGNRFLLGHPDKALVVCSRSLSERDIDERVDYFMRRVLEGAVLVSACISPGEKAVMRAAYEHGARMIVLLENGFSQYWKPGGRQFDACAGGRLLLVAPWPHHNERRVITREQCLLLNDLARNIVLSNNE